MFSKPCCLSLQWLTLLGLSNQFCWAEGFRAGRWSTTIHCHYHRHHYWLPVRCLLYVDSHPTEDGQRRRDYARRPSSPNDRRRLSACAWSILVCRNVLSRHQPMATDPSRNPHWHRSPSSPTTVACVSCRHIHHQCQLGHFRHRYGPVFDWWRVPTFRCTHVPTVRGMLISPLCNVYYIMLTSFLGQVMWATSFLGLFAVSFAPIPMLFYFYGARIRSFSRYVPQK